MQEEKIDFETASKNVESWLDHKKIRPNKREAHKEYVEDMISAVQYGILVINEDFTITQKLDFPIPGDEPLEVLTYAPRLHGAALDARMKGVKNGDGDGRLNAVIAALTKQSINIPKKLDTSTDKSTALSIAIFFL